MLPPYLRALVKQIDQTINEAAGPADDRSKRADETQKVVVVAIESLANEIKTYQAAQETADSSKRRSENWTLGSLIATAVVTLALAVIAALQWCTLEKPIKLLRHNSGLGSPSESPMSASTAFGSTILFGLQALDKIL